MRSSINITKLTCDRCKKEVKSLTTLYKTDHSAYYDPHCGHRSVGDLCEVCFWEFENFMDGLSS